jgi:hypothetical protein
VLLLQIKLNGMEDKDIIVLAFAFLFSAVLMIVLNIYSKRRDAEIKEIFKEMDEEFEKRKNELLKGKRDATDDEK